MKLQSVKIAIVKQHTAGILSGLTNEETMTFANKESAMRWVESAMKGHKECVGGGAYIVTNYAFV